jgi:23S rRNA pseudouridine955/2504/2580 synthase
MIPLLFENDEIIVVDKPPGLAALPGEGVRGDLVAALERQLGYRPFPVHRLDKETAGCMILAKNSQAAGRWSKLIVGRDVTKRYDAWVFGMPDTRKGVIDTILDGAKGLQKARTWWYLKEVWRFSLGEEWTAQSDFQASGRPRLYEASNMFTVSRVELELATGRMHQIRRHLAGIGLPIVADDRHGDFGLNRALRRGGVKRLLLWACELVLPAQPSMPGGAVLLASEPPHFAAFREFLLRSGTPMRALPNGRPNVSSQKH